MIRPPVWIAKTVGNAREGAHLATKARVAGRSRAKRMPVLKDSPHVWPCLVPQRGHPHLQDGVFVFEFQFFYEYASGSLHQQGYSVHKLVSRNLSPEAPSHQTALGQKRSTAAAGGCGRSSVNYSARGQKSARKGLLRTRPRWGRSA